MFITLFAVTTSAAVTTWIVFSIVVYLWHYFIEVVLDLPIIGQSPCSAHASLKLLIQRIIQEAIGLPTLQKAQEHPGAPAENTNRTYEDLLATAILNKVIQNYQDDLPTSSANSVSSRVSHSSRQNDKEYFFGEETLETKWKNGSAAADVDTTSVSSLDEWVRSDSSVGSTKYVDHMSLTIQQRIEEVSSSDDDADIVKPVKKDTLATEDEAWEENWSMQKRKFGGTASPVPVPMLVPNPTIEAKVLIGDRDAEDTTDLSDAGSDFGDVEVAQGRESILVESKTVIGGKNLLASVNVKEEEKAVSEDGSTDAADIVEETERVMEQFMSNEQNTDSMDVISETLNIAVIDQTEQEDMSPISLESHTEQDSEYTEKYATLPRTILKTPTPQSRDLRNITDITATTPPPPKDEIESDPIKPPETEGKEQNGIDRNGIQQNGHHDTSLSTDEDDQQKEKFKGSYSEREKEKWNHAIEMKNNPYSPENLSRRLSGQSNSSNISMFGRDYYVREASKSAGARKKLTSDDDDAGYQQIKSEFQPQEEDSTSVKSPTSNVDTFVYKAVPAVVDAGSESPIEIASPIRQTPNVLEISSDSDLSIERVYNLNSGKVYEKLGDSQREIIARSKNPEGRLSSDFDTNTIVVDENHNTTTDTRKRDFLKSLTETSSEDTPTPISSPVFDDVFNNQLNTQIPQVPSSKPPTNINETFIKEEIIASNNESSLNIQEFSLEYSTDEYDSIRSPQETSLNNSGDPEITGLKDQHLVKDRLGIFSKSYPNLAAVPLRRTKKEVIQEPQDRRYSHEVSPSLVKMLDHSVGGLKKKFETPALLQTSRDSLLKKEVHSLTARSLSREFRQELKGKENGIARSLSPEFKQESEGKENGIEPQSIEQNNNEKKEPKAFSNARSRIQFFESLNH